MKYLETYTSDFKKAVRKQFLECKCECTNSKSQIGIIFERNHHMDFLESHMDIFVKFDIYLSYHTVAGDVDSYHSIKYIF